jgi:hypothetical protein
MPARRALQGLLLVGVASIALGIAGYNALRDNEASGKHRELVLDWDALANSLVALKRGQAAGALKPLCQGTVFEGGDGAAMVLTGAHCIAFEQTTRDPLWVIPQRHERDGAVLTGDALMHPKFSGNSVPAAYDVAVVALRGTHVAHPVRVRDDLQDTLQVGSIATLFYATGAVDAPSTAEVTVLEVSTQRVLVQLNASHECQGLSGAPLVVQRGEDAWLIGVVSHGNQDCTAGVSVSRLGVAIDGFLDGILGGPRNTSNVEACGACIDRMRLEVSRCSVPVGRCQRDAECEAFLECASDKVSGAQVADCRNSQGTSARTVALQRCVCAQGCKSACDVLCSAAP